MGFLLISFLAGVLTILAPCILPVLPVIIGGSIGDHERRSPLLITASLAVSVVLFTLVLKVSTAFIDIPASVWSVISGGIILGFGLTSLFPVLWEKTSIRFNLGGKSNTLIEKSNAKKNHWGDILLGAALGPVFSSCSPTYFLILATVLPKNFAEGFIDLIAYAIGLSLALLLIASLGQRLVKRIRFAADPHGWFKRGLGLLFVIVGIFIITGGDKKLQTCLLQSGYFDITKLETRLLKFGEK